MGPTNDGSTNDAASATPAVRTAPQWVVFRCEQYRFAFPTEQVREIVSPHACARLPGCGPEVLGLINLRGVVATAFDFGVAVSLRPASALPGYKLLILDVDQRIVAFAIEEVLGVARVSADRLSITADALRALEVRQDDLLGIGELDGEVFVAMDPARMVAGFWE